jgi:hypothetical protein
MKDLIIVGSYCPDSEREGLLDECISSLQKVKDDFDILICSHSQIPKYVIDKVDYFFYDKNNELIYDMKYLNQPWFSPFNGLTILSTMVSNSSTYLAAYRLFIFGLGLAKAMGYNKVHWLEYDSYINNPDEFYDNSRLLEDFSNVLYKKESKLFELNLDYGYGFFQSINTSKLDSTFLEYNKKKLLEILLKSGSKTNEKISQEIFELNDNKIYYKDYKVLFNDNNRFELSKLTKKDSMDYWTVPFYDNKNDTLKVIVWNHKDEEPINVNFIVNGDILLNFKDIGKWEWSIKEVGNINNDYEIVIIVNNKIKTIFTLNDKNRKIFKETNYTQYD